MNPAFTNGMSYTAAGTTTAVFYYQAPKQVPVWPVVAMVCGLLILVMIAAKFMHQEEEDVSDNLVGENGPEQFVVDAPSVPPRRDCPSCGAPWARVCSWCGTVNGSPHNFFPAAKPNPDAENRIRR